MTEKDGKPESQVNNPDEIDIDINDVNEGDIEEGNIEHTIYNTLKFLLLFITCNMFTNCFKEL